MSMTEIPLGEWMPDAPSFKNPGLEVADNTLPIPNGYGPIPGLVDQGQNFTEAVQGARHLFTTTGDSIIVGGGDTSLFVRRTSITETTGLTSIGSEEAWDFAQFNSFVVATAVNNDPQYLTDIDSDDTWSTLTGSPPQAKRCAKVGDFLMLGAISGAPSRIQWSAFNNPTGSWAASRLTQAGSADLPTEYGEIQKIVGGRFAVVFQKRGIQRLSYVGPPVVWRADEISTDRGAVAPFAVVTIGYLTYFLAQDGFFVTDGASVEPVGTQRINKWFYDNVQQSKIAKVQGAVDWQNKCIFWAFNSQSDGDFDRAIIYSWEQNRWSSMTLNVGWLVGTKVDGVDLDSLDAIYGDLDSIDLSLDSEEFKAKDRRLAAFAVDGATYAYSIFEGTPLEATWLTGEFQPSPNQRVFVYEATPAMDATNWDAEFTLLARGNQGVVEAGATVATGWNGFAPVRGEGSRMALRMTKPSGPWNDVQSVNLRFRPAGYK